MLLFMLSYRLKKAQPVQQDGMFFTVYTTRHFCVLKLFLSLLYAEAPEDPMASMLAKIKSGGVQLKKVTAVSIPSCIYSN